MFLPSRIGDDADLSSLRFHAFCRRLLVQALRKAGRDDLVVASFDDLSFGPIDPPRSSLRAKWVENELGNTEWHQHAAESERDWNEARFPAIERLRG
jgi:hypothetical protein